MQPSWGEMLKAGRHILGKLVAMDDSTVQLQLAGPEGARRRRRTIIINPSRPHGPPLDTTSA